MGCSHKPPSVYVDINQCIKINKVDTITYSPIQVSFPYQKFKFPSLPQDNTFKSADDERLKNIKKLIHENTEKSFQSLLKELENIYLQELDGFIKERNQEMKDKKEKWAENEYLKIREIFMRYAPQHGKNLWRIAFIAGFPDSETYLSTRLLKTSSERSIKQELNQLTEQNRKRDGYFRKDIEELMNQISLHNQEIKKGFTKEIEQHREKAHQRAYENAISAVQFIKTQIKNIKKTDYSLQLPAIKEKNIYVPSVSKRMNFDFEPQPVFIKDKELCQIQLEIWSKLHDYSLTSNKNDTDKTKEFLEWKKKYELETISNR